jgi:hypothetical protein
MKKLNARVSSVEKYAVFCTFRSAIFKIAVNNASSLTKGNVQLHFGERVTVKKFGFFGFFYVYHVEVTLIQRGIPYIGTLKFSTSGGNEKRYRELGI